jgi:hypothetical protein
MCHCLAMSHVEAVVMFWYILQALSPLSSKLEGGCGLMRLTVKSVYGAILTFHLIHLEDINCVILQNLYIKCCSNLMSLCRDIFYCRAVVGQCLIA